MQHKRSSTSSLDVLFNNLIRQGASIAENISMNLFDTFEQLSALISDLVNYRQEYAEQSKRILTDLAGSKTTEQVQRVLLLGLRSLSSLRKSPQSIDASWFQSRVQYREQARKETAQQEQKTAGRTRHWTFQRSDARKRMRHRIPITKIYSLNEPHDCSSHQFLFDQLLQIMQWTGRFLRL